MKTLRTAQSAFPRLKTAKEALYVHGRRILKIPHDGDYGVIRCFTNSQDLFLDVGANQGQTIESILLYRRDAQIISFEPNISLAHMLQGRYAEQTNITVYPLGLGNAPGTFTLYIPIYNGFVYDGLASLKKEEAESWLNPDRIYGFKRSKLTIEEVQCRVETLDALDLAPTFIKIDVQGYEDNVLLGGGETLARHQPVLLVESYTYNPKVQALLQGYGYQEYYFDKGRLRKGHGASDNSILVTERRIGQFT
jgi:FkbM family methyltransferase